VFATLQELRSLYKEAKYDDLLAYLSTTASLRPLTVDEFLLRGRSIQLSSETSPYELEDAEKSYLSALELDSENVEARLELGWYYFAVQDDAQRALQYFQAAIVVANRQLAEGLDGKQQCESEIQEAEQLDPVKDPGKK
jgi:tetratricopeptide (TPR) repeat protein